MTSPALLNCSAVDIPLALRRPIHAHELTAGTAMVITHRPQVLAAHPLPESARALGNAVSKSITLAHVGVTRIRANRCPATDP